MILTGETSRRTEDIARMMCRDAAMSEWQSHGQATTRLWQLAADDAWREFLLVAETAFAANNLEKHRS